MVAKVPELLATSNLKEIASKYRYDDTNSILNIPKGKVSLPIQDNVRRMSGAKFPVLRKT